MKRDGEWVPLESNRPMSDDPEIERLWDMNLEELNAIVDDEANPVHDKAVVVASQAFAPLTELLTSWNSPDAITDAFSRLAATPGIDRSWVTDLVIEFPGWKAFRDSLPEPSEHLVVDGVDLDSAEAPDLTADEFAARAPSIAAGLQALLDTSNAQLQEQRDQNVKLGDQLRAQRDHTDATDKAGRDALAVAKSAKTGSWFAAWAAIAGALIGVAALIVAIVKP